MIYAYRYIGQYRCVNTNYIDLFQRFYIGLINVCKVIRGQLMKGTIALIITTGRILAFYHYQYLMPSLLSLSPFTEGEGSILSGVSTWTHGAGSLPTVSACTGTPALHLLPSPNFFSLGMCSTEAGEELVSYFRTVCKSGLELPNQFLKEEACIIPSFVWSKRWICLKQWRLHISDPEPMFKKAKKDRYAC